MTGIGKTALAERLASDFVGTPNVDQIDNPVGANVSDVGANGRSPLPYIQVILDRGSSSADFTQGAIRILHAIGDDTAQQLPDAQILPYLLQTLERQPCWLQLDSLEYLLCQTDNGDYRFADATWVEFFFQFLTASRQTSRIVLTSQAMPMELVERIDRYDQLWHDYSLRGLEQDHWLDLFRHHRVTPQTDPEQQHLCQIASYFQGHPLILKMIVGDIRSRLFGGSISKYWHQYYSQRQTTQLKLPQSQEQRARHWVDQTIAQLPDLPRTLLQRGAVFRRAVPEAFYLQLLDDLPEADCATLLSLKARNLVEDTDIQNGHLLIQQHNLIRDSAYAQLKNDRATWEAAERQAAHLWLTAYEPAPDAERLETIRGKLEAFDHYCEVGDWNAAKTILLDQQIGLNLQTWGKYSNCHID